jgi:hypothetical protein
VASLGESGGEFSVADLKIPRRVRESRGEVSVSDLKFRGEFERVRRVFSRGFENSEASLESHEESFQSQI